MSVKEMYRYVLPVEKSNLMQELYRYKIEKIMNDAEPDLKKHALHKKTYIIRVENKIK